MSEEWNPHDYPQFGQNEYSIIEPIREGVNIYSLMCKFLMQPVLFAKQVNIFMMWPYKNNVKHLCSNCNDLSWSQMITELLINKYVNKNE